MAFLGVKRTIHHLIVAGRLKGVIALVSLECWAVVTYHDPSDQKHPHKIHITRYSLRSIEKITKNRHQDLGGGYSPPEG